MRQWELYLNHNLLSQTFNFQSKGDFALPWANFNFSYKENKTIRKSKNNLKDKKNVKFWAEWEKGKNSKENTLEIINFVTCSIFPLRVEFVILFN